MQRHLSFKFQPLILCCFILITCLLSTGCWMTPIVVDSSPGAGTYLRATRSPVLNWSLPVKLSGVDNSNNFAADTSGNIYSVAFFSSSSIGVAVKYPHSPLSYSLYSAGQGVSYMNYTDLCIDKKNKFHYCGMAYDTAHAGYNLYYVTNILGNVTSLFLGIDDKYNQTNIMTDSVGITHIVYYDTQENILGEARVAISTTGTSIGFYGLSRHTPFAAAGIGADDRIHVLGFNTTTNKIEYLVASNTSAIHNLCSTGTYVSSVSPGLSIKVDKSSIIHAVYCAYDGVLRYAVNSTGGLHTWSYSTIDMTDDPGKSGINIAFDSKGKVYVIYTRNNRHDVYLASLSGSTWDHQLLKKTNATIIWPKIIFNTNGELYISYWDNTAYDTYFMAKSAKMTYISYCDTSSNLKYATEVDGMSGYEIVTTIGTRESNDIAVDNFGIPHIAFASPDNTLKIATRTNSSWSFETAFNSQVYQSTYNTNLELKYDLFNHPHLLYVDKNYTTVYGVKTSTNWSYNIFTLNHYGTPYISLAITTSNLPRFAYTNVSGSTTFPVYVYWNGSGWSYERIYNVDNISGHRVSMILDGLDNPHVAYLGNSFKSIIYSSRKNGIWNSWTISTSVTTSVTNPKIALDEDQNPHVVYYCNANNTNYYQRMIKKTGQTWMISNANDVGKGGIFNGLTLELGYQPGVTYQFSTANSLNFRNSYPEFYNLPDIKLLRNGYTITSAFNLNEYFRVPASNWDSSANASGSINPTSVSGTGRVSYGSMTGNGYASDTHLFVAYPGGTEHHFNNRFKYVDIMMTKLPRLISEGSTIIENPTILMTNYFSRSSTYSVWPYWGISYSASGVNFTNSSYTITFSLVTPIHTNIEIKNYMGSNDYGEDLEIFHLHPILNSHSGFTIASETTNWAYQLPESISTKPGILWDSSGSSTTMGGTPGSMVVNFTAADQGIKLTHKANNWVKTEPYEWYTLRVLARAAVLLAQPPKTPQVESPDAVSINIQFLAYAFNGVPPAPTDVAAHFTAKLTNGWRWFEVPIYSSSTSMYPILVVKNGSTLNTQVLINKVEIIKAKPGTELMYSKKWVNGMLSQFDSSTETTAWAFESVADPAIRPNYTIDSGKLIINFPDWNYRGIKFTSMVSPGTVRTGKTHTGKMSGVSFKYSYSGYLYYPVITFYLFNSAGVNNATFSEFAACGSLYKTTTNEKGEYRSAYLPVTSDGYVQVVLKNGGPGNFYIDDLALESDWDTNNYWDSSLY